MLTLVVLRSMFNACLFLVAWLLLRGRKLYTRIRHIQLVHLNLTSKDIIRDSVLIILLVLGQFSQHSDGFGVLQALLCCHHPHILLSTAPTYSDCLALHPTLCQVFNSQSRYLGMFEHWMDCMRLYFKYSATHCPSQFSLWFICGLTPALRQQFQDQEQIILCFQAHFRAQTKPELLPKTAIPELGQLLDVFASEPKAPTITDSASQGRSTATIDFFLIFEADSSTIY